jgi:hypothetical protein
MSSLSPLSPQAGVFQPIPVTPQAIKSQIDAAYSKGLTQSSLLGHVLHQPVKAFASIAAEAALGNATIVCLDAEWYEHSPAHMTELGISILTPSTVNSDPRKWESPWGVMRHLVNYHVRIKPNAHLVNGDLCPGHPDSFQFGRTSFVDKAQAHDLLKYAFQRKDESGRPCPIVFIGHAVDNDIQVLKQQFGFDVEALGVGVATLDTQVMVMELAIADTPGRKMRLSALLGMYGITEQFLHNAGNDTVTTMIAAMLMAYKTNGTDFSYLYANYKTFAKANGGHKGGPVGDYMWCTRCEAKDHFASHCRARLHCHYCAGRGKPATRHATAKCPEAVKDGKAEAKKVVSVPPMPMPMPMPPSSKLRFAVPCSLCIQSPDPKCHSGEYAYGHQEKECRCRVL